MVLAPRLVAESSAAAARKKSHRGRLSSLEAEPSAHGTHRNWRCEANLHHMAGREDDLLALGGHRDSGADRSADRAALQRPVAAADRATENAADGRAAADL